MRRTLETNGNVRGLAMDDFLTLELKDSLALFQGMWNHAGFLQRNGLTNCIPRCWFNERPHFIVLLRIRKITLNNHTHHIITTTAPLIAVFFVTAHHQNL